MEIWNLHQNSLAAVVFQDFFLFHTVLGLLLFKDLSRDATNYELEIMVLLNVLQNSMLAETLFTKDAFFDVIIKLQMVL